MKQFFKRLKVRREKSKEKSNIKRKRQIALSGMTQKKKKALFKETFRP